MLYGIDISDFQAGIDLGEVRREGFDFVVVKATEGSGYASPAFDGQLAAAQGAGLIVAAYHYVTTDPVGAQVANIRSHVPPGMAVIPDVEANSGDAGNARAIVDAIRGAGYPVPLLYLPHWYWEEIGSPDLTGLPPLWSSKYPTTNPGTASGLYQNVDASYWDGYGGLGVAVLQFASSAKAANTSVDADAYLGTRDELAALLGGEELDLTPEQDQMLRDIHEQLYGDGSRGGGNPDGWPQLQPLLPGTDYAGPPKTLVDFVREVHRELCQRLPNRVDGKSTDTVAGFSANADASSWKILQQLSAMAGALTKEEADLLAAMKGFQAGQVDPAALAKALAPLLPAGVTADQIVAAFAAHLNTPTTGGTK